MANPWPEIESRLRDKLARVEEKVTNGSCRSYDHYRYLTGAINSLRDVLDIASDIINPKPPSDAKTGQALEEDEDF